MVLGALEKTMKKKKHNFEVLVRKKTTIAMKFSKKTMKKKTMALGALEKTMKKKNTSLRFWLGRRRP
jgi:hypothetical protein